MVRLSHGGAVLSLVLFLCSPMCSAQLSNSQVPLPPNTTWARPDLVVPICTSPPRIDGILNDPCWQTAARTGPFARLTSPVVQQTAVSVCADSRFLYVAFHCYDSQPQLIHSSETERNGNTWVDDYVSVDIDSQGDRANYSQFIVTERGTQNENLEGGTASNITWAGDWHAVTHRTSDGWTAEMSIPFALLHYPRGTHSFGVQFERKLAREESISYWPERPPKSQSNPVEYFATLSGINPTFYKPQPIFLPYMLVSGGEGTSAKYGMDIKYPLSSSLTGLATFNPDFGTVEQNVTNINFSYTQKYINDQRPFFIEGSGFFPYSDVFYSPSVPNVDEGLKVTGKQNGTSVALLAVNESGVNYQHAAVASFTHQLNPLSNFEMDYAGNDQAGLPKGDVFKTQSALGWHVGKDVVNADFTHTFSWRGGRPAGGQEYYQLSYQGHPGHPSLTYQYTGVAPNFNTELGFESNYNFVGPTYDFDQNNSFDKGYLQNYDVNASWQSVNHWNDGSFFYNNRYLSTSLSSNTGNSLYLGSSQGHRLIYRDHVNEIQLGWNNKSLYDSGSIDYQRGAQSDDQYTWYAFNQGYGITRRCSVNMTYNYQDLGGSIITQAVFTPTYRLTTERSIGGRIVSQSGNTDIYLTYAQQARTGADVFFIIGNPNSATTQGLVQLKVVDPF